MKKSVPTQLGYGYKKAPYINTNSLNMLAKDKIPKEYQDADILNRLNGFFVSKCTQPDFLKEGWTPDFLGHLGSMDICDKSHNETDLKYRTLVDYVKIVDMPSENMQAQFDTQFELYDLIFDPELMKIWTLMHINSPYWKTDSFIQIQDKVSISIRGYITGLDEKFAYKLDPKKRKKYNGFMTLTEFKQFGICIKKNPEFMGKLIIGIQAFQDMWASSLVRYNEAVELAIENKQLDYDVGINILKAIFQPQSLWRTKISTEDYAPAIWLDWILENKLVKFESNEWVLDLPDNKVDWPTLNENNFIRGTKWLANSGAFIYRSDSGKKIACPLIKVHPKVTSICTKSHQIDSLYSGKLIFDYFKSVNNIPRSDYDILQKRIENNLMSGFETHDDHHL